MDQADIQAIAAEVIRAEQTTEQAAMDLLTWLELILLLGAAVVMGFVPGLAAPMTLIPSVGLRTYQCLKVHLSIIRNHHV